MSRTPRTPSSRTADTKTTVSTSAACCTPPHDRWTQEAPHRSCWPPWGRQSRMKREAARGNCNSFAGGHSLLSRPAPLPVRETTPWCASELENFVREKGTSPATRPLAASSLFKMTVRIGRHLTGKGDCKAKRRLDGVVQNFHHTSNVEKNCARTKRATGNRQPRTGRAVEFGTRPKG